MFTRPLVIGAALAVFALAQVATISPVPQLQFFDNNGKPLAGGCLNTYAAGTTTPLTSYQNAAGATNTNPIILDSSGRANVWLGNQAYKFVLRAKTTGCAGGGGATLYTVDSVQDQGFRLRSDLALSGGGALVYYAPPGASAPATVQSALASFVIDSATYSPNTLQGACNAAVSQAKALLVTKIWTAVPTMTCAASLDFAGGGRIAPAASATVTLNPNFSCGAYQQCFDASASGAAIAFSSPAGPLNPNWFGADSTGAADSLPAFTAAYAAGDVLNPVNGTYTLSGPLVMNRSRTAVSCAGNAAILQHTGTTDVTSIITLGRDQAGNTVTGCGFRGNAHVTKGAVYGESVFINPNWHSTAGNLVRDINCTAVTPLTDAMNACVYFFNGNTNVAENIQSSSQRINQGIVFEDEANSFIIRPKLEVIVNEGIKIFHGSGLLCSGNIVIGGTSEGNGTGLLMACQLNIVMNLDLESNSVGDFVDSSTGNRYMGTGGGFHFTSTATRALVDSGGGAMTIDAGAKNIIVRNFSLSGSLTDNGTCTVFENFINTNGGNLYPDKHGCNNGTTFQQGVNLAVEVPSASITAATCASGVATYTANAHGLPTNFLVTITGASPSGWNLSQVPITRISANQFTAALTCPGAWVSGGVITGSADNALSVVFAPDALSGLGGAGAVTCPPAAQIPTLSGLNGMPLTILGIQHNLQAGANTMSFCGSNAWGIKKFSNAGQNLGAAVPAAFGSAQFIWYSNGVFLLVGQ